MSWYQGLIELAKKVAMSDSAKEGAKKAATKGGEAAAGALVEGRGAKGRLPPLDEADQDGPLDQRWELQSLPEALLHEPPATS